MFKVFTFLLISQSVLADICSHELYVCNYNKKRYALVNCSGNLLVSAFCTEARAHDSLLCEANDNDPETDKCNAEWNFFRKTASKPSEPKIETYAERREKIKAALGRCAYDGNQPKVSEIANKDCGDKKYICTFHAQCTKGEVTGQCFTNSGCPMDPIDCIAVRDIVGKHTGRAAIQTTPFTPQLPSAPGTTR